MTLTRRLLLAAGLAAALIGRPEHALAQEKFITLASTTSTEQSGLFGYLLPKFQETSGIQVRVVAVGTGQALEMGRKGMRTRCSSMTGRARTSSWPRAMASTGAT